MKRLLKTFVIAVILPAILCFFGCNDEDSLFQYVSELRTDVLEGERDGKKLKANLFYAETPKTDDGKVGKLLPYAQFILSGELSDASYYISFTAGGKNYSGNFAVNPVSGELFYQTELRDLNFKTLTATVKRADDITEFTLCSILPEGVLSPEQAIKKARENGPALFNAYINDSVFNAEISLKITVKDGRAFYFFGISDGKSYKVFLCDGKSGEVLAVRDVF